MIIDLPKRVPSQNQFDRAHWTARYNDKAKWLQLLRVAVGQCEKSQQFANVTITRYAATPIKDFANFVGGAKGLVDAMTTVGLLQDDSDEWCKIEYRQEKCRRVDEHTTVEITYVA